jgi:hypothetical protein
MPHFRVKPPRTGGHFDAVPGVIDEFFMRTLANAKDRPFLLQLEESLETFVLDG